MARLPRLDTTFPALILKASRSTLHHGALGIARSLGRLGVPVYAVVEDTYTPLASSRYLTKAFVWKSWPNDNEALVAALLKIGEIINRSTILIPMDDFSAVLVAENAVHLSRWFLLPQVPPTLPRQLANKRSFYSLCSAIGIPCARSLMPYCADDIREFGKQITFPIVAKAAAQWQPLNKRYNVKILQTRAALFRFCEQNEDEYSQMVLQEYVPGTDWIYHGYCNSKSNLYVSFTGKKLLDYPPDAGSTAVGLSAENERLCSLSERVLQAIAYSGISDIDWRKDSRDGQYKIMDCNPRIGMNFRIFQNHAGIDVVRAQHLDLTGRSVDPGNMTDRRLFVVEPWYLLSSIRGGLSNLRIKDGKDPLSGVELAWWSRDDVIPFLVMSVRLAPVTLKRALRNTWKYAERLFNRGKVGSQNHAIDLLVISRPEDLTKVAEAWDRLRRDQPRFFQDFESIAFFLSDQHRDFRVVAVKDGDQITCIACFVYDRRIKHFKIGERSFFDLPVNQVNLLGSAILGNLDGAFAVFIDAIRSAFDFDLIWFGDVQVDSALYRAIHARTPGFFVTSPSRKRSSIRWLIKLPKSFDDYLAQLSQTQRGKVRRKMRRVEDELDCEFRVINRLDQVEDFLRDAEAVSRLTYQWNVGDRVCNDEATRRLYVRRATGGHLRCYVLCVSRKPCAFIAGELIDNKFHYEISGYDPQYAKLSPGTVLLMFAIRDLIEKTSCEVLDFGQGGDVVDYKSMFGNIRLDCEEIELGRWSKPYSVAIMGLQEGLNSAKNLANWFLRQGEVRQRIKKALRKYGDSQ